MATKRAVQPAPDVVCGMYRALGELLAEMGGRRAVDWKVVNDACIAAADYLDAVGVQVPKTP